MRVVLGVLLVDKLLSRELSVALNRQQVSASNQADFYAQPYFVQGRFLCDGAGELVKDVSFPVVFTEEPFFAFGGRLEQNQVIVAGNYPTVSAVVLSFSVEKRGVSTELFRGARLIIVTTGEEDQKMWLQWQFSGMALVNPVGGGSSVGGVV